MNCEHFDAGADHVLLQPVAANGRFVAGDLDGLASVLKDLLLVATGGCANRPARGGIKSVYFRIYYTDNPNRTTLIVKTFFLANGLYRYSARILRDHGNVFESDRLNTLAGYTCQREPGRASDKVVCAGHEGVLRPRMARSRDVSYSMARMVPAMLV
jgi:hypothetical protein